MMSLSLQLVQDQTVLKSEQFIPLLEDICGDPLPKHALPNLKYKRILIPNLVGGELAFAIMGFFGQALRIRGAEVTALSCDSLLPACVHRHSISSYRSPAAVGAGKMVKENQTTPTLSTFASCR